MIKSVFCRRKCQAIRCRAAGSAARGTRLLPEGHTQSRCAGDSLSAQLPLMGGMGGMDVLGWMGILGVMGQATLANYSYFRF